MSESHDYVPAPQWQGHDFQRARARYDQHVSSSYQEAVSIGASLDSKREKQVSSKAQRPLIIVIDETSSMGDWPATMFSKLPYLDHEVRDYLGDDAEICFAAIGDAHKNETYALQVRPFATGKDLEVRLKQLTIENKGGGNGGETYELAALYFAHNLSVSAMAEPIVIFIGDEPCFDSVSVEHAAKYACVNLDRSLTTKQVFAELQRTASVYFIQKPYGSSDAGSGNSWNGETKRAHDKWVPLVGESHIAMLPDPNRVVDVIFGILAAEVDRIDDFREEIEGRQKPGQVKTVYKSLETIHAVTAGSRKALRSGNSVMLKDLGGGDASTPLA